MTSPGEFSAYPGGSGNVTCLFEPALRGEKRAQEELFREVMPEVVKLARHWLTRYSVRDRVPTFLLVNEALLRLIPPVGQSDRPDLAAWPHRGAFFAFLCRLIPLVLIDLLRQQRGKSNSKVLPNLLVEAIQDSDVVRGRLGTGAGDLDTILAVLSELIWSPTTCSKILQAGGDPSAVSQALQKLLKEAEVREIFQHAKDDPERIRQFIVERLRSDAAKRLLVVYEPTSSLKPGAGEEGNGGASSEEALVEPARGLTHTSFLTLHEALEEMDRSFARTAAPRSPREGNSGDQPPREERTSSGDDGAHASNEYFPWKRRESVEGQILDLRIFGDCTWEEIAAKLSLPPGTVRHKVKVAVAFLKQRLRGAFDHLAGQLESRKGEHPSAGS